jgi:prolyl oligopeptidase
VTKQLLGAGLVSLGTLGWLGACGGHKVVAQRSAPPTALGRAPLPKPRIMQEKWPPRAQELLTRREEITEQRFGELVSDPYRWLEDDASAEVKTWVERQNELTERTLAALPARDVLRKRLSELLAIGSISLPAPRRTRQGSLRLFYTRREAGDEQPILYVRDGLRGADRVLFDPNQNSPSDGSTALDWYEPSQDGSLLAYGISQGGSEDSVLYVRDVKSGRDLSDQIDGTRFASICWLPDGAGFFYSRYPAKGTVPAGEERFHRRIYLHRLGQDPQKDSLVFGAELPLTDFPSCTLSPNGRWLVINVGRGWSESALYLADALATPLTFARITPEGNHSYSAVARNDALYVMSDDQGAARYRIFAVDPRKPQRDAWRSVVSEPPEDTIRNFEVVGHDLLLAYLHDGSSRLERFGNDGRSRGAVELPTLGTSDGFVGVADGSEAFFAFESFALAPEIRRLDLHSGKTERWQAVSAPIRSEDYRVDAFWARSKDGTRVPYHAVYRRDLTLGAEPLPTVLYGYGGFNENIVPRFSRSLQALLERGGVYVQAILRGGGEFGESWHRAGQLEHKQNVFDDFISVAEALIARKVTTQGKLAIHGRSNGGLLVAATVTQRPELFRAAVAGVPLTDMVRYPLFLIGKLWVPEYGSPEDEQQFRALLAYSPYHRVRQGVAYPAVLVTTAESDTRVAPLHARKFVAALQAAASEGTARPVLLRTQKVAGHGAGTPVSKLVLELSDVYAFLFSELGLPAEAGGPGAPSPGALPQLQGGG